MLGIKDFNNARIVTHRDGGWALPGGQVVTDEALANAALKRMSSLMGKTRLQFDTNRKK